MNTRKLYLLFLILIQMHVLAQTPIWLWSQSSRLHWVSEMEVDIQGNLVAAGVFNDSLILGNTTYTSDGSHDIIVVKYSPNGNIIWSKVFRSDQSEGVSAVACDGSGNYFIAGGFSSKQFTLGSFVLTSSQPTNSTANSQTDIFVAKLDVNGSVIWAQSFGNPQFGEGITDLDVDSKGDPVVTGTFYNALVLGSYTLLPNNSLKTGDNDFFVAKLSAQGTVSWAQRFGGSSGEFSRNLVCDSQDNIIVSGVYTQSSVIGTQTLVGKQDIYLLKLNSSGSIVWLKSCNSQGYCAPQSLACDPQDNIILLGEMNAPVTVGSLTSSIHGAADIFLAKCSSSGTWTWIKSIGHKTTVSAADVCVDAAGNSYLTGRFDVDSLYFNQQLLVTDSSDFGALIIKVDGSGNSSWVKKVPGNGYRQGTNLACGPLGELYFVCGAGGNAIFDTAIHHSPPFKWMNCLAKMHVNSNLTGISRGHRAELSQCISFPNPTSGLLIIQTSSSKNTRVEVYDVGGALVMLFMQDDRNEITIDLSALASGLYLVRIPERNDELIKIVKN